ncbi:MAG: hypothetical protein AAF658_01070 [Myxococcota bacterium]
MLLGESCDGSRFSCTVVTAPEPDCVVCAFPNGAVAFSSCVSDEPDECVSFAAPEMDGNFACESNDDCPSGAICFGGACQADADVGECRVCFDTTGNTILDECGVECGNIGCPDVQCGAGFEQVVYPGECCPQCVPAPNCSDEVCPIAAPVPNCPAGTALTRDPRDCCSFLCAPNDCSLVDCAASTADQPCPAGFERSFEFPNCCGTCVPSSGLQFCESTSDCEENTFCTTEIGACFSNCDGSGNCVDVCLGLCRPVDFECPDFGVPDASLCEGTWVRDGVDSAGCPLPPVCVCPDGRQSFDGSCEAGCENVQCSGNLSCEADERLEFGFPYCCGVCVPANECLFGPRACENDADCGSPNLRCLNGFCFGLSDGSAPINACPPANCGSDEQVISGPNCCPVCAPQDRSCTQTVECESGERCTVEFGDCQLDPACGKDASSPDCSQECFGICVPG